MLLHLKLNAILKCSSSKYFARNPKPLTLGVKIQLFQNNFMLHVKLKGITNAPTWSQIFCLQTAPNSDTGVGIKGSKLIFIRNLVMLQIKLKRIRNALTWQQIFCQQISLPNDPRDGVNQLKFNFFRTWSCCTLN